MSKYEDVSISKAAEFHGESCGSSGFIITLNFTPGKNGDSYSPQAQEKDLEMSGKIDEQPRTANLYDNVDVIKNPNAERFI